MFVLGVMLPDRGTQVVARALALSPGRLPATVAVRLPVVVVSAPTPFAPLVAFRPLKRLSGLVDVLLGVGFAATPAVVPASVGVPFVPVVGVVAPLAGVAEPLAPVVPGVLEIPVTPAVLVAPVAPYVEVPLVPACPPEVLALTCPMGQGVRGFELPGVVCWALPAAATAVLNSMAIPAIRHRTMCSVNSVALVMCASSLSL